MEQRAEFIEALQPLLRRLATLDPATPGLGDALNRDLGPESGALRAVEALVRRGAAEGWLAPKGRPGLRFGRISRADPATLDFSVDAVIMDRPGPGHVHPRGEFDLCFALDGDPRFDGRPAGWTVKPPGSWHVPTVAGGAMAILYFLPGGAFQLAPAPPAAE